MSVHEHKLQRPTKAKARVSLIPQTLKEMEDDPEFQRVAKELELKGQKGLSKQERQRRQRALDTLGKKPRDFNKSNCKMTNW